MSKRKRSLIFGTTAGLLALLAVVAWRGLAAWDLPTDCAAVERPPRIRPDYSGIVIPPNIAPLSFLVEEPGVEYRVRIHGTAGEEIVIGSHGPTIAIPLRPWRQLLARNRGRQILFDVFARDGEGRWSHFSPFSQEVAEEEIDSHLAYRLLGPVCNLYSDMGIHQRNLENFDQSPILTYDAMPTCVNCHTFQGGRPDMFSLQVRSRQTGSKDDVQSGMILARNCRAYRPTTQSKTASKPPAYTSWHPSKPVAVFTMIHPRQYFHGAGDEIREVFDSDSDLAALDVSAGAVSTPLGLANRHRLETFPGWSADGKVLYFSSAEPLWDNDLPASVEAIKLKYDLMCVRYDAEKDTWGQPEVMLSSAKTDKSISQAKASPDGRYLLFCMSDYGTFCALQPSSDLYFMEIASRKYRRLECNSPQSDSWHCWSSNSRWIVFSSKRDNGLLARPYFCYIDKEGREHKPFVLPQKDPTFYDTFLKTYNVPELISGPVTIPQEELVKAVRSGSAAASEPQKPIPVEGNASPDN
jgi:hypothetical protein